MKSQDYEVLNEIWKNGMNPVLYWKRLSTLSFYKFSLDFSRRKSSLCYKLKLFRFFTKANSESALGKYAGGVAGAAGDTALFVANHAY